MRHVRRRAALDNARQVSGRRRDAATSRHYRSAFARRRCLIPANGWYEWRRTESGKQPFCIILPDLEWDEVVSFSGRWERMGEGTDT
jgi:putative SOS response-associated peptidase YedK